MNPRPETREKHAGDWLAVRLPTHRDLGPDPEAPGLRFKRLDQRTRQAHVGGRRGRHR